MARPIEFDRSRAIRAAIFLFWRQGYLATTLPQLLDAMGIGRSSFYAAFKDKRSLFIEVLDQYNHRRYQELLHRIPQFDNPADAISHYIEFSLRPAKPASVRDGCLMVNTLLELRGIDDQLADLAVAQLGKLEKAFAECFENAIESGNIESHLKPIELSNLLITFNHGLRVASRKGISIEELKSQSEIFSTLLLQKAEAKPQKQSGL